MSLKFSATSVDECLEKASSELNISKEALKYRVTKEQKGFFKKKVEIEIIENEINSDNNETIDDLNKEIENTKEPFGAKVEAGKIIVTDSSNEDDIITIKACPGVNVYINDQISNQITPVTSKDKIEYKFDEIEPVRSADISITADKMEVYISIKSTPIHIYELEGQEYQKNLTLTKKKVGDKYPPKYTQKELSDLLASKGVRYGIIKEELEIISEEYEAVNRLVAKGLPVVDDVPDEIKLLFKESEEMHYKDTEQKVDYRNRFFNCKC